MIDSLVEAGNKVLAVTGNLQLYGLKQPNPTWTRLISSVKKGDTIADLDINFSSAHGWAVGDEIVFGPTGYIPTEYEKKTITAIAANNNGKLRVTLNTAFLYNHYGDLLKTFGATNAKNIISDSFGGDLDMRAAVGHITRSIVISGND